MKANFVKILIPILVILILCTGCGKVNLIGDNNILLIPTTEGSTLNTDAVKYKNGTVVLKDNNSYNTTDKKNYNPETGIGDIKFGPHAIELGFSKG